MVSVQAGVDLFNVGPGSIGWRGRVEVKRMEGQRDGIGKVAGGDIP
jgi:hypothetical protein